MENNTHLSPDSENKIIGYVVGGGLQENLNVRLTIPAQQVQEGAFVVMDSENLRFYGLVTDMLLGATDPRFADEQSENRLPAQLAHLLHGQTLFTNLSVMSTLMLDLGPDLESPDYEAWRMAHPNAENPKPVKTIPRHHTEARLASEGDIAEIFGVENGNEIFRIGETREQGHPVCIDLDKLIQRSSGIFGATGTGKSFLTRVILAGLIHADKASALIFDMHNEYGPDDVASDSGQSIPGLKNKFPSKVRLVGLGANASFRGANADYHLEIAESDIRSEDILMLTGELNLRDTTATTLAGLERDFSPSGWFHAFKTMRNGAVEDNEAGKKVPASDSVAFWANQAGINALAAEGLHSKLGRLFEKTYLVQSPAHDTLSEIIRNLDAGKHIILSFGDNNQDLDYLLVTNLITRRIRDAWEKKTNAFRSDKKKGEPRPLVVVVEEAHKLLNREMASQTTFSTIAREMRKYYVTLLIIDQRPSQIYDEVMSQLGTRISGWLGDDDDISSVLSGLAGRQALRGMLARLQPKEEVLMLGWGVPMPIPIRSRRYDQAFWQEVLKERGNSKDFDVDNFNKEMGF
ncbi:MAG: DUF87 domain-containing protein [Anaerolineaceae bacterium]|nr:DUF87 domain-containing protein [Anaerolineaceae bacterium]